MKSVNVLQAEAKILYQKLELEGKDRELQRKLLPLLQGNLQAGDHVKLAKLLGYPI